MLKPTLRARFLLLVLVTGLGAASSPAAAQDDHPLVRRYEGSVLKDRKAVEFGEYRLATGRSAKGELEGETYRGRVTRIVYENPSGRSTLEIFRNYQQALQKAGATTLYTCSLDECGPAYARSAWNRFNGLYAAADGDPHYLSARLTTDKGTAYVGLMVGKLRTQLDVVEIKAMQEDLVVVDAAALSQGIDRDGKVSVYGIFFDTDRSDLKPESQPALVEIGKLLKDRPSLRLFVVGHTDMTGDPAHNRTLSEARARAVVKALVDTHKVAASRLEGHGVGPLAPVASNTSETGRAKNRRVELVAR